MDGFNPNRMEIALDNIRFFAHHGLFKQENTVGNEFEVNLTVEVPVPGTDDNIENTISYVDLYDIIKDEMSKPRKLLETLCIEMSERIKNEFPCILSGMVSVCKLTPPIPGMRGSAKISIFF